MAGPLPNPNKRRRNAPTIPGTSLPAEGRKGPIPDAPYELGSAGRAWWVWAWGLPQAAAWDAGALYGLARRAELEDRLEALGADGIDLEEEFSELLAVAGDEDQERKRLKAVESMLRKLKSLSGGAVSVMREMRELDNRFGLNAKAMADLRWSIAPGDEPAKPKGAEVRRLRAVDPAAAAS